MEYASKAVGNAGLTTGIIGTALGALGGGASVLLNNGNMGGRKVVCSDDEYVTRYELGMQKELMQKDREIAILTSEQDSEKKMADVYERIMTKVNQNQRDQADWNASQSVANAQMTAAIATNANSINSLNAIVGSVTKVVVPNSNVCPGWGNVSISPLWANTNGGCCNGGTTLA